MKSAIAIDFDGTVTRDDKFPNIGKENYWVDGTCTEEEAEMMEYDHIHMVGDSGQILAPATYVIKRLSSKYVIVFFTCRTGDAQKMMIDWLSTQAFTNMYHKHDYYINHNPYCPEAHEKPFADVYMDNRGLHWHPDLHVEKAINHLISSLPKHEYIPTK